MEEGRNTETGQHDMKGHESYHLHAWLRKKTQSVCIHALGPQIHPLDFNSVRKIYSLKSIVKRENTP